MLSLLTAHGISSFDHYKVDVLDRRHSMNMKPFPVKQHKLSGFSKELGNVIKPRGFKKTLPNLLIQKACSKIRDETSFFGRVIATLY